MSNGVDVVSHFRVLPHGNCLRLRDQLASSHWRLLSHAVRRHGPHRRTHFSTGRPVCHHDCTNGRYYWSTYWASIVLLAGVCRRLSGSVTLHGRPAGSFSRAGQVMTLWRLQCNYSFTVTLHGGPVRLRSVRATPCLRSFRHRRTQTVMELWNAKRRSKFTCRIIFMFDPNSNGIQECIYLDNGKPFSASLPRCAFPPFPSLVLRMSVFVCPDVEEEFTAEYVRLGARRSDGRPRQLGLLGRTVLHDLCRSDWATVALARYRTRGHAHLRRRSWTGHQRHRTATVLRAWSLTWSLAWNSHYWQRTVNYEWSTITR